MSTEHTNIRNALDKKSDEELLAIWKEHDDTVWEEQIFSVVLDVLQEMPDEPKLFPKEEQPKDEEIH